MTRITAGARLTGHDDVDFEAQPVLLDIDVLAPPISPPSLAPEAPMVREEEVDGSATLRTASLAGSRQSTNSPTALRPASICQEGQANSESPVGAQEDQSQIQVDEQTRNPGVCMTLRLDVSLT